MTGADGTANHAGLGPKFENVDELTSRAFTALRRLMHVNRLVVHKLVGQEGRYHGEIFALARLADRDGISQRELGKSLHLSPPRVSTILDSLEKSGAVVRRADEKDRRVTRVFVTAEGRERQRQHLAALGNYVNSTIGALTEAERMELERLLTILADRIGEVLQEGGDPDAAGSSR